MAFKEHNSTMWSDSRLRKHSRVLQPVLERHTREGNRHLSSTRGFPPSSSFNMIFNQSIEQGIGGVSTQIVESEVHNGWLRNALTWIDMVAESNKDKPRSRHVKKSAAIVIVCYCPTMWKCQCCPMLSLHRSTFVGPVLELSSLEDHLWFMISWLHAYTIHYNSI